MAASAAQKLIIGRNLGLADSMFAYVMETTQGPKTNSIAKWRETLTGNTTAVPADGGTDLVLIAGVAAAVAAFAAS